MAYFTGPRRGELIALRWRDVDFAASAIRVRASFAGGALTTLKSGKGRSVPIAPEFASALAKLADRARWTATTTWSSSALGVPVRRRGEGGRHTAAALPRPAPHVRHADDRQGGH